MRFFPETIMSKRGWFLFWFTNWSTWFWTFFIITGTLLLYQTILLSSGISNPPTSVLRFLHLNFALSYGYLEILVPAYGAIFAFSLSFLYPGRLVFTKPPIILLTSIKRVFPYSSKTPQRRDAVIVPISCVNTGTSAVSLVFSLVAMRAETKTPRTVSTSGVAKFTNDFTVPSLIPAPETGQTAKGDKLTFDQSVEFVYTAPFAIKRRSAQSANCVFLLEGGEKFVSQQENSDVIFFLFYRSKPLGRWGLERLRKCKRKSEESYPPSALSHWLNTGGWKMGFSVRKHIDTLIVDSLSKGKALGFTDFEYFKHPSRWSVPLKLLSGDIERQASS